MPGGRCSKVAHQEGRLSDKLGPGLVGASGSWSVCLHMFEWTKLSVQWERGKGGPVCAFHMQGFTVTVSRKVYITHPHFSDAGTELQRWKGTCSCPLSKEGAERKGLHLRPQSCCSSHSLFVGLDPLRSKCQDGIVKYAKIFLEKHL